MISRADRLFVTERAESRCEYCLAPQVITGVTFHIEHIIPRTQEGADSRANYALSCITCNGHKAHYSTGIDPETKTEVQLFNPRRDKWDRHFLFAPAKLEVRGTTPIGRATVARLQMNEAKQIEARELWVELGIYP
ncbi:MAG: HNH endonuclease signature motif containing protein [Chthoniobacter sp.]